MAAPDAGPDGAGAPELELGIRPAPSVRDHGPGRGEVSWRAAEAPARWSARTPSVAGGQSSSAETDRPEEVAVCALCGLVSRRPFPPACPACGGGYG